MVGREAPVARPGLELGAVPAVPRQGPQDRHVPEEAVRVEVERHPDAVLQQPAEGAGAHVAQGEEDGIRLPVGHGITVPTRAP